jgi:hypothetical protein
MKPRRKDSPPEAKAKAAKPAASSTPPAARSRKKALAASDKAVPARLPAATRPRKKAISTVTGSAAVVTAKIVPAPTAPGKARPAKKREQAPALQKAAVARPAKAARAFAVKPKKSAKAARRRIPPILLEGDAAAPSPASGPGRRYVLGPAPPPVNLAPAGAELPESYGTQQLFLAARDPRWLYAHWDFSAAQISKFNALSADGHLLLRLYRDTPEGQPLLQIHLHPESRHWFVPAPHAGAKYVATLGYCDTANQWTELACSAATLTPPDSMSDDTAVRFATIPPDVPLAQLLATVQEAVRENVPLAEAVQQLRADGFSGLPEPEEIAGAWSDAQELALAQVVMLDPARRIWIGSLEVTELIRRQLEHEVSSIGAAQLGLPPPASAAQLGLPFPPSAALGGVASPSGRRERQRGFWFNINAELIIYGSTEPDAAVSIGGRQIQLRPDGSFSFRFALPDGSYQLAVAARSADGAETREAGLYFSRASQYEGGVGAHPREETLQPPPDSAAA